MHMTTNSMRAEEQPMQSAPKSFHPAHRWAAGALALLALAGCDFKVTNPGPVDDRYLDDARAHAAVVQGAVRSLGQSLNYVSYTTAAITRELFPAGSTSSFGITPRQQQGILAFDDESINAPWLAAQRARFIAESGFERFAAERTEAKKSIDDYPEGARAALYAGYANRILGDNWCQVLFDGGPAVPADSALKRAEAWFTRAYSIAQKMPAGSATEQSTRTTLLQAALAGRASVRATLGNWAGAADDAAQVPTAFKFQMQYSAAETDQYNRIFWAGASTPYRAHTVWRTVNDDYYTASKDPRTPWALHATQPTGDAAVMDLGRVPFHQQRKYTDRASPINLSSGREMRLLEAEALLRKGDWNGAMTAINALRTAVGVGTVSASNLEEAWTRLKRERGIELWLEGRRMGDLRRWSKEKAPGQLDVLEKPGEPSRLSATQTLCYDFSKSERETNPNLPRVP
jgi:hypothetical protein